MALRLGVGSRGVLGRVLRCEMVFRITQVHRHLGEGVSVPQYPASMLGVISVNLGVATGAREAQCSLMTITCVEC